MSWDQFVIFAIVALLCWGIGAVAAWRGKRQWMIYTATLAGLAVFFAFILGMWISLERPPMRTMGETRLWYSFFMGIAGQCDYKSTAQYRVREHIYGDMGNEPYALQSRH